MTQSLNLHFFLHFNIQTHACGSGFRQKTKTRRRRSLICATSIRRECPTWNARVAWPSKHVIPCSIVVFTFFFNISSDGFRRHSKCIKNPNHRACFHVCPSSLVQWPPCSAEMSRRRKSTADLWPALAYPKTGFCCTSAMRVRQRVKFICEFNGKLCGASDRNLCIVCAPPSGFIT